MLRISEHFEYYHKNHFSAFEKVNNWESYYAQTVLEDKINFYEDQEKQCVSITLASGDEVGDKKCSITSSYYIGLDRFPKLGLNVYVEPKLNKEGLKIDYVKILLDSLTEPQNFEHLN